MTIRAEVTDDAVQAAALALWHDDADRQPRIQDADRLWHQVAGEYQRRARIALEAVVLAAAVEQPTEHARTVGDDVVVQLRVRRANLPALEAGVHLGTDSLTGRPIEMRLWPRPDGVHELEVVTNPISMIATPEPVDAEVVHRG